MGNSKLGDIDYIIIFIIFLMVIYFINGVWKIKFKYFYLDKKYIFSLMRYGMNLGYSIF